MATYVIVGGVAGGAHGQPEPRVDRQAEDAGGKLTGAAGPDHRLLPPDPQRSADGRRSEQPCEAQADGYPAQCPRAAVAETRWPSLLSPRTKIPRKLRPSL